MTAYIFLIGASFTALVVGITDYRSGQMPNLLTLSSLALAVAVHFFSSEIAGLVLSLSGVFFCGLGPAGLFFFTKGQGIGGGDVKALMALGAWLGPSLGLESQLFGFILLFFGALSKAMVQGRSKELLVRSINSISPKRIYTPTPPEHAPERTYMRFGPYLAVAVLLTCTNHILTLWFSASRLHL